MNTISRRDLFKIAGSGALLAALPFRSNAADAPVATQEKKPQSNSSLYRFRIGDWEATSIAAGIWDVGAPHQPGFAPQATPEDFKQALLDECLPTDKLRLYFNVLLVRTGKENILIDAGFPGGAMPANFDVISNLAQVGLKKEDISMVFLSHAHGDHMGGMLDGNGKPVFTAAEHFCSSEEIGFWTSPKPDLSTARSDDKARAEGIAAARRTFDSIKFTRLTASTKLPEGVLPVPAFGHTPGHLNFRFQSKGEAIHHIVDLAHHFALMIPHPDWTVDFDVNEKQAAATRKEIFSRLAAEGTPVFGYHLPHPALGRLKPQGAGYRWVPRTWDPGV